MKKNPSIRLNRLIQSIRQWIRKWTNKDDDDLFDHPFAIF